MIEIVDQSGTLTYITDRIRKISREVMMSEEIHDLFVGRVVDISVTDNELEFLNYDRIVISTEIRVSKKDPKIIRLTIVSEPEDPSCDILYSIGYGSSESLDSSNSMKCARMTPMLQGVYQSYREVLLEALQELAK